MIENEPIPKLTEIAERIAAHLIRMEATQPDRLKTTALFFHANAWPAGSRVGLRYISYQGNFYLAKADALAYLRWLDAGNFGRYPRSNTATKG